MAHRSLLIIDDDRSSRDGLQSVFISRGWEVAMVTTEDQGVELLADYDPDWIIVAWQQVNGTGTRLFHTVRAKKHRPRVGVLTDGLTATERAMLKRLQPDVTVAKPFVPEVVYRTCTAPDTRLVTAG